MKLFFSLTKKSNFIYSLFLVLFVFLFSSGYTDTENTSEIKVQPFSENIETFLENELNKKVEITTPKDLLKRTDDLLNLIDYLYERNQKELAQKLMDVVDELYKEGIQKFPSNVRIYDSYGAFLYDYKKDLFNAVALWEKGYKLDETDASICNNLALHYFHIGEYDKGWKYLQEAIKHGEKEANIFYNSAQIFILYREQIQERTGWDKEKIYKKAMEYSEKAVKINPNDFELMKDYALNFFTAVQFGLPIDGKKSAMIWEKARKLARNDDEVFYTWVNEGRAWLAINELKRARECLAEALKIRPDSVVVKNIITQIDSGEIEESIEEQKNLKNRPPEQPYRNPLISPFKNFSGKGKKNPLLPQQPQLENMNKRNK